MSRNIIILFKKLFKTRKKKAPNSYYFDSIEKSKVKAIKDLGMTLHDYRM